MARERVLIVGAGIAGSILAFWLAKHDFQVVVIERSKVDQKLGQGLEIEEPALKVVKKMGIMDKLKAKQTTETGLELVNSANHLYARFEMGDTFSPTGDLEVMRGDLTEVFYEAADESPNVTYHFGTTIRSLRQTSEKVFVDLEDRNNKAVRNEEFDLVVGADGAQSRTRQMIMGSAEELGCFKPIGAYVSYFSVPREDQDWPYARMCHFPNRRLIWTRPTGKDSKETSVYVIHLKGHEPRLHQAKVSGDRLKQKEAIAEVFSGLGWEAPRIMRQMMDTPNFYFDELAQVKLEKWSSGRVVLVGDAAWAPTPFTGQGNQLAIIGAWVLAQEMSKDRSPAAFEKYENRLRPRVETSQKLPLGGYAPSLLLPQTTWGIFILRIGFLIFSWIIHFLSRMKIPNILQEQPDLGLDMDID